MARYDGTGFIVGLEPDEIFVFGSNLAGRHGAGAAKQAVEKFGAQYGVGEGLTGMCYAFPTLDNNLQKRGWSQLVDSVEKFYDCVEDHPDLTFYLTKVGTGLGGYDEEQMATLFVYADRYSNIVLPEGW